MMKKCYALLMAIVMVVSAGSMVFAANDSTHVTDSGILDSSDMKTITSLTVEKATLTVENKTYTATVGKTLTPNNTSRAAVRALAAPATGSVTPTQITNSLHGVVFRNVMIEGELRTVTLEVKSGNLNLIVDPALPKNSSAQMVIGVIATATGVDTSNNPVNGGNLTLNYPTATVSGTNTTPDTSYADIENLGNLKLSDVVLCKKGMPLPLTENNSSAEKGDRNDLDGVRSGSTLYFMIRDGGFNFDNDLYWKLRVSKGTNGKYIKKISDVSKTFSKGLFDATDAKNNITVDETKGRHRYIKVELNEIYTDDEYKITLDLRLTPKQKAVDVFGVNDDAQIKVKDFYFYMKNAERAADNEWTVGTKGLMLNPLENDWNEVTYYDEDGDVAFMRFFADSDVDKFFAKLSTKWEHADYASYFNDQDAFVFNFTGSPKISSTSRCDLQIYNPFIDDDGNETIDPTTAVIYQVIDGDLYDVTDSFTYEEGDNGDMAYVCRTRFLGTYVICEKTVEEAI